MLSIWLLNSNKVEVTVMESIAKNSRNIISDVQFWELQKDTKVAPSDLASTLISKFGNGAYIEGISTDDLVTLVTITPSSKKDLKLSLDGINFINCTFIGILNQVVCLISQDSNFEHCTFQGNIKFQFSHQSKLIDSIFKTLTLPDLIISSKAIVKRCKFIDTRKWPLVL